MLLSYCVDFLKWYYLLWQNVTALILEREDILKQIEKDNPNGNQNQNKIDLFGMNRNIGENIHDFLFGPDDDRLLGSWNFVCEL